MSINSLFNILKFTGAYDNYPDAVIVLDHSKSICDWNLKAEKIFGFSKQEVLTQNISFILFNGIDKIYQCVTEDRSAIVSARSKSRQDLFVEISAKNNKGKTILTARDVTRTHKVVGDLLQDYESTNQLKEKQAGFICGLANEIRNPLHSILGFSQALLDGLGGPLSEKQDKYLNIINKNSTSLLSLMNNVIDLAKYGTNKFKSEPRLFDVIHTINLVIEAYSLKIQLKKLNFAYDITSLEKRTFFSDEPLLKIAISNLLDNAIKFCDGGNITLKVIHPDVEFMLEQGITVPKHFTDKSYLMFSVEDTGIGIAEHRLNDIFDEYKELDKNSIKKYGGTGLSLAITRKIIEELGGIIWVESAINKGSRFSFIIPAEDPSGKVIEHVEAEVEVAQAPETVQEEVQATENTQ